MAEADFGALTGSALDTASVPRGVTAAFTRPTGGGSFCCGFRATIATPGFAGYYLNLANFNPITGSRKCGSIRGAMKRYSSGASYAPIMGFMKGTNPGSSDGYMIGLSGATAYQIALKKGSPAGGLDPTSSQILRLSTDSYTTVGDAAAGWFHLRLDVLVNPHGEVVLNCYQNTGNVTTPTWAAIDGMDQYIDDSLGALTGSTPYLDGFYCFFGQYSATVGATTLWDQLEVLRQTAP